MHCEIADLGSRLKKDGASMKGREASAPGLPKRRSGVMRAAFVIAVLLAVPCVPLIPETGSDGADGTMADPVMLLGSGNGTGGTIYLGTNSTQIPTYFDLNTEHFYDASVAIDIRAHHYANNIHSHETGDWSQFNSWDSILKVEYSWGTNGRILAATAGSPSDQVISEMTAISSGGSLSIKEVDSVEGFYVVAFSAKSPPVSDTSPNGCFVISIMVTVKEHGISSSEQKFYFGANIRYQSQGGGAIPLPDSGEIAENLAVNICLYGTNGLAMDLEDPISMRHHEDEGPFQARVLLMHNGEVLPINDPRYNEYLYYATGLPDGLNMRSDGTIAGKLAGYVGPSTVTFTIYGVNNDYTTDRVS